MKIISNFKDYYDSVQVGEAVRWDQERVRLENIIQRKAKMNKTQTVPQLYRYCIRRYIHGRRTRMIDRWHTSPLDYHAFKATLTGEWSICCYWPIWPMK